VTDATTGQAEAPRPEAEVADTTPATSVPVETGIDSATSAGPVAADIPPDEAVPVDHAPVDDDTPVGLPEVTDFRMALVSAVTVDLPNQHPTVVLRETESPRRQLSFSIGFQDGVVLSHAVRRIGTPRPLTHELLTGILHGFHIDVVAVRLVGRQGAVYFAELDLRGKSGRSVHACRPSDALTIALLQPVPAPILIDRRLLEESGDVVPR
jgi:bifunctional DNase/RNase